MLLGGGLWAGNGYFTERVVLTSGQEEERLEFRALLGFNSLLGPCLEGTPTLRVCVVFYTCP